MAENNERVTELAPGLSTSEVMPPFEKVDISHLTGVQRAAKRVVPRRVPADNITLGTACGKMYRTSVLSIIDIGDSDIMRVQEGAA